VVALQVQSGVPVAQAAALHAASNAIAHAMRPFQQTIGFLALTALVLAACGTSSGGFADPKPTESLSVDGGVFGDQKCNAKGRVCVGADIFECDANGKPKTKVASCDGSGEACVDGECKTGCAAAAVNSSNVGCEFWAVDLDNEFNAFSNAAGAPWMIVVSNAGLASATVKVEMNEAAPGAPQALTTYKMLTVAPRSLESVDMPTREVDGSLMGKNEGPGTMLSSRAFRITSSEPIVVYQFNTRDPKFSNDASLLLPTSALGQTYRALSWPSGKPVSVIGAPADRGYVTVVGTQPGTSVTVKVAQTTLAGGSVPRTEKDGTVTVTLGAFDVLNLETEGSMSDFARSGDLTGSVITSTAPVAVFVGTELSGGYVGTPPKAPPSGDGSTSTCCLDHLEEQLLPVESYGKNFAVPRSPPRGRSFIEQDSIRFMGVAARATVKTSLPAPNDSFTLEPGQIRDLLTISDFVAEATEPVAIGQVLLSAGYTEEGIGDPSLSIMPAIDQFRRDYIFLVPGGWKRNYIAMAMPEGAALKLDGSVFTTCAAPAPMGTIAGTKYVALRCDMSEGAHTITGDKPFGIVAYGYGNAGSYAFVGGSNVRKIYTPPPIR
jgi:hypothetical protein